MYFPYIRYLENKKKNSTDVSKEVCSKEFLNMVECYKTTNVHTETLCKQYYQMYLSCLRNARAE